MDKKRAESALLALDNALTNPFYLNINKAVREEMARLYAAIHGNYQLLWSIYRRNDKGEVYY